MSAKQLITDHLDVWTGAHKTRSIAGRGSNNKLNLHGIKKLRELILELAVRGKLVPQDASDEQASELLKKISIEKERLIKEGKIKKEKSLPEITDEEKPFELPSCWEWARLGNITNFGSTTKVDSIDENCWVLDLEDIEKDTSKLLQKIRFSERGSLSDKNAFVIGDVLYGKLRPYLNKVIVADEDGVCTTEILPIRCYGEFVSNFFKLSLKSPTFVNYVNERSYGMKMPRLGTDDGRSALIALPPLPEQHRIVTKVDELMAFCDQLEQTQSDNIAAHAQLVEALLATLINSSDHKELQSNWQRLAAHFDTLFTTEYSIDQLKQTILQLAVMGKLVPQNKNDEPASELLKKIAAEKAQLIKEGKIKKEKSLPEITDEEKPFELPSAWEWVSLGNVHDVSSSKRVHAHDYCDDGVPFYRSKEIGELGRGDEVKTELFISRDQYERYKSAPGFPQPGDFMLASIGGSIGNNWICDGREFYYKDGNITKVGCSSYTSTVYLKLFMDSGVFWQQVLNGVAGSAYNALTIIKIKELKYPLPSLAEQHRIVAKVDELMALCDTLKTNLQNAQTTQLHLADALVEQALVSN